MTAPEVEPAAGASAIRVLHLICPTGLYGAERWILALAHHIDPTMVTCELAVTDEGCGQDLAIIRAYPERAGPVHRLAMRHRFDPAVVGRLVQLVRERGIQIVHTHGYKSDILGILAAKRAGVASISTPHGFDDSMGLKLRAYVALGNRALRFFDAVAPLSEDLCMRVRAAGVVESRIRLIRNGVNMHELAAHRWRGPAAEGPKTVGYVGQLIARKNLASLIQAFDLLWRARPDTRLKIVGDGPERANLERLAEGLPSGKAVEFLGYRADRLALMADFDVFAMTSSMEGIPRCLMECMAIGVPVAAYDIPGVDALVTDGVTGRLVRFGDEAELAAGMMRLLDDPVAAVRFSAEARRRIEQDFSGYRMAREYTELYRQVLSLAPSPSSER